jgi:hypothetical protein
MAGHSGFNMQFMEMPVVTKTQCTIDHKTEQTSNDRNLNQGHKKLLFAGHK